MLWETSRALAVAVVFFVLVEGLLPPLAFVAIGRATGHIPAAVRDGLDSAAGRALLVSLAIGAAAYALSLLRGPFEDPTWKRDFACENALERTLNLGSGG